MHIVLEFDDKHKASNKSEGFCSVKGSSRYKAGTVQHKDKESNKNKHGSNPLYTHNKIVSQCEGLE